MGTYTRKWFKPVISLALVTIACDGRTPTSPTSESTISINFDFDGEFWKDLVYNGFEQPDSIRRQRSKVLDNIPNFYIRLSGPKDTARGCGSRWNPNHITYMRQMIPHLVEQLTGHPYQKTISTGCADRNRKGWVTIVPILEQDKGNRRCGVTRVVGEPAGRIWLRTENECYGINDVSFRKTFAHELGHAMGFWHVPRGYGYIMTSGEPATRTDFTEKEWQHARLAYQRSRDARLCRTIETCSR